MDVAAKAKHLHDTDDDELEIPQHSQWFVLIDKTSHWRKRTNKKNISLIHRLHLLVLAQSPCRLVRKFGECLRRHILEARLTDIYSRYFNFNLNDLPCLENQAESSGLASRQAQLSSCCWRRRLVEYHASSLH